MGRGEGAGELDWSCRAPGTSSGVSGRSYCSSSSVVAARALLTSSRGR